MLDFSISNMKLPDGSATSWLNDESTFRMLLAVESETNTPPYRDFLKLCLVNSETKALVCMEKHWKAGQIEKELRKTNAYDPRRPNQWVFWVLEGDWPNIRVNWHYIDATSSNTFCLKKGQPF